MTTTTTDTDPIDDGARDPSADRHQLTDRRPGDPDGPESAGFRPSRAGVEP